LLLPHHLCNGKDIKKIVTTTIITLILLRLRENLAIAIVTNNAAEPFVVNSTKNAAEAVVVTATINAVEMNVVNSVSMILAFDTF
ncbi:9291_t:CDS:1, partial [Racocetra persica]